MCILAVFRLNAHVSCVAGNLARGLPYMSQT